VDWVNETHPTDRSEGAVSTTTRSHPLTDEKPRKSRWATGLVLFAGVVMMVAGVWHALAGIGALLDDEVYVATPGYVYSFDLTRWGWIHLLLRIVVAAAGFAVVMGMTWARVVGIALASLSMVANFMFVPYYPLWSLLIIALDIAVIWALITYRTDLI
jgi:hypothetical protein